jgi:hypothetical protein
MNQEDKTTVGLTTSSSYKSFLESHKPSLKISSYFFVYDHIFKEFVNKEITFVEIGVLNGGSLLMWRNFFGPNARIIGIDLNPAAQKSESDGFEIYIGNQANENFWEETLKQIGQIDILLDDGGHTYKQQVVTANCVLPFIKNGGLLVTEDTITSYRSGFGPKRYTFMKYVKNYMDYINLRSSELPIDSREIVWSITVFGSIVVFHVDRSMARVEAKRIRNKHSEESEIDFRYDDNNFLKFLYSNRFINLKRYRLYESTLVKLLFKILTHFPKNQTYKKYFEINV